MLQRPPRVPELPPRTASPLEPPSQVLLSTELPSQSPPLPARPDQGRLDVWIDPFAENQEKCHEIRGKPVSAIGVELPAVNVVPSVELEAQLPEAAKPVELPTTRDSNDLGPVVEDSTPALEEKVLEAPLAEQSQNLVDSATTTEDITRPQSTDSDLYNSSIRNQDGPRPQSASSTRDTKLSETAAAIGLEDRTVGDRNSKAPSARSITTPPYSDSDLYKSTIQAPKADDNPTPEKSHEDGHLMDPKSLNLENLGPTSSNVELETSNQFSNSSPIMADELVATEMMDKLDSSGSQSGSTATQVPRPEFESSATHSSKSDPPEEMAPEEFSLPGIEFDGQPPTPHNDEDNFSLIGPFSIQNGGFEMSLERQIDNQLRELQNHTPENTASVPPARDAPLPPSPPPITRSPDIVEQQPKQSIDGIPPGLRSTGVPSRYSQDHISSIDRVNSDYSSASTQDHQTIRSSPTTISSNTIDTVTTTDTQGFLRGQAQTELRQLQVQLAEAKRRGDTHTVRASIQRSIELIQRTYLSESSVGKQFTSTETVNKLGVNRKSLMRLPSFSHLSNAKTSALIEAANIGDLRRLGSLLEEKVNANARGDNYRTPQMAAAIHGHLDCLSLLKNHMADEFAIDGQGRTVMHVAVMANRLDVVNYLLGAYPPSSPNHTPKSWRLFRAAHAVKDMISHKILREVSDAEGSKPLHLAAKLDLKGMVELLLMAGADIESKNNWSRTALHEAVLSNLPSIAQTLITRGAKVEAVDAEMMSPLHLAAKLDHKLSITLLLAKNAHRYAYNSNGDLPIHVAARQGHLSAIEALITNRTDLGRTTRPGETLLHVACLTNGLELAEYLVRNVVDVNPWARPQQIQFGSTVNVYYSLHEIKRTDLPQTPLHYACTAGLYEMSVLLLDHGAWVNATPDDGRTALMMAVESGNTDLVCLLLARGAKVNATMPGSCLTAMHISARRGDLETTQQLFRKGANMLARTSDSHTPREYCVNKIKDADKQKAMDEYLRRIDGVRIYQQRQAQARAVGDQREWTLQGLTDPANRAIGGYNPLQPDSQASFNSVPQAAYPQYNDENDSFPEALPAYTPGPSAPRNLADRAPVHRPTSG